MPRTILVTGGAGFIGSHVVDRLLARGDRVRVLDDLDPQVHGEGTHREGPDRPPAYLDPAAEFMHGSVCDRAAVERACDGVDAVIHLAAAVGVGQSMYRVEHYTRTNTVGTAVLLETLAERPIGKLVVASSMSIYGEGLYTRADGGRVDDATRRRDALEAGAWEPLDGHGRPLDAVPTPEDKHPALASVYALSKYDQERLCLVMGEAYGIPTVALRFFNAYGPRQALGNPYTGVLAIFAARYLNGNPPLIFEDGHQRRDFVSVHDVARACLLALDSGRAAGEAINIGSGQPRSVREVAVAMGRVMGREHIKPEITGEYRVGDIRHCYADIRRARELLGYAPRVAFEDGLDELATWLAGQTADDRVGVMKAELAARGLTLAGRRHVTERAVRGG